MAIATPSSTSSASLYSGLEELKTWVKLLCCEWLVCANAVLTPPMIYSENTQKHSFGHER